MGKAKRRPADFSLRRRIDAIRAARMLLEASAAFNAVPASRFGRKNA
jgi:hypothetical protein